MDKLTGKWLVYRAIVQVAIVSIVCAANAFAAAVVQDVKGDVRVATGAAAPAAVAKNEKVISGQTLTTGPGSQVILRFDDDQRVVLNENTEFKITDSQFQKEDPKADRAIFELLRGAARFVSGLIGRRSRPAFEARTPTAAVGIRGTDFMLAYVNSTYFQVTVGQISVTNAGGTATFGAGAIGTVATANTLAVAISATALPAAVADAFSNLSAAAVGAAAAGAAVTIAQNQGGRPEISFDDCSPNGRLKFKDGKNGCLVNHPTFLELPEVGIVYYRQNFRLALSQNPAKCPAAYGWSWGNGDSFMSHCRQSLRNKIGTDSPQCTCQLVEDIARNLSKEEFYEYEKAYASRLKTRWSKSDLSVQ